MRNYRRIHPLLFFVMTSSFLFLLCASSDQQEDARYRQKYELLDAEKSLMAQEEDTSRQIFQLTGEINEKQKALQFAYLKLKDIKRQIISIQMKLLP
ncbi:MAG: hypothetical protein SFY67_01565 [Candidatus Melainabacteria bacterium]|nr:hypothetical protein [Candidatus Melainabacteria bacterium]